MKLKEGSKYGSPTLIDYLFSIFNTFQPHFVTKLRHVVYFLAKVNMTFATAKLGKNYIIMLIIILTCAHALTKQEWLKLTPNGTESKHEEHDCEDAADEMRFISDDVDDNGRVDGPRALSLSRKCDVHYLGDASKLVHPLSLQLFIVRNPLSKAKS